MRRMPQQQYPNSYVRRERDPRAARLQLLLFACCLTLAVGFIFAVRQQMSAVEYGYKTETLRREREQLLDEQRRLRLAVGERSSPARLEQAAHELGMQAARAEQIENLASHRATEQQDSHVFVGTATAGSVLHR